MFDEGHASCLSWSVDQQYSDDVIINHGLASVIVIPCRLVNDILKPVLDWIPFSIPCTRTDTHTHALDNTLPFQRSIQSLPLSKHVKF